MVAWGSVSIKVTDSVVGKVPGSGNAVGRSSLGPDPCGSGGPNCAWRKGAMQRNVISISRRNNVVPPKTLAAGTRPDPRLRCFQLVNPMPVFPNQRMEELRSCIRLQYGERLASDALARKPGCAWVPSLGDARAVSVGAGAVEIGRA